VVIIQRVDPPLFTLFNPHKYFASREWVITIEWIMYFLIKKFLFQSSEAQYVLLITDQKGLDQGGNS